MRKELKLIIQEIEKIDFVKIVKNYTNETTVLTYKKGDGFFGTSYEFQLTYNNSIVRIKISSSTTTNNGMGGANLYNHRYESDNHDSIDTQYNLKIIRDNTIKKLHELFKTDYRRYKIKRVLNK